VRFIEFQQRYANHTPHQRPPDPCTPPASSRACAMSRHAAAPADIFARHAMSPRHSRQGRRQKVRAQHGVRRGVQRSAMSAQRIRQVMPAASASIASMPRRYFRGSARCRAATPADDVDILSAALAILPDFTPTPADAPPPPTIVRHVT